MTATGTRTRKPPTRSASLQTVAGVLWITRGPLTVAYRLERIPTELGGVAFQLSKAHQGGADEPEVYHVLLNGRDTSCTCAGHSYGGGRPCKHISALEALTAAGKL